MYAANTFLRIVRFISNTFIGLVLGFLLGYAFAHTGNVQAINSIL
jgi:uncharacterized membrane protein YccC